MKKINFIIALCFVFVIVKAIPPQTLPIDYTSFFANSAISADGLSLERGVYADATQSASAPLMANQWSRSGKLTSGEGGGVSPLIENSTLSYSNYIDNNVGKAIILNPDILANPDVASSTFRTSIYSLTSSSTDYTGTYYVGMLVNFSKVVSSGVDFLAMDANYSGNSQRGRVFVKNSSNTGLYNMGVGFSGTSDVTNWSGDLAFGTTYFIVLKYITAATGGTETATLFLNPTPGELEATTTSLINTVSATAALKSIKGFIVRQRPNMGGKLAGLRFSNNWADVVKASSISVPKLSTPIIGSASDITATGFKANWSSVSNAVGYDVKVYQGTTLISTTNVAGQSTSSMTITGLSSATAYTYKVLAKGNGTDYSDSNLSESSTTFSTSGVSSIERILTDLGDGTWGTVTTTALTTGSYPSSIINGFNFVKAYVYTGSITCPTGETHTNRIVIDRNTQSGALEFPALTTVGEVEIHAVTGTAGMSFRLEEWVNSAWQSVGTYNTIKSPDSIYTIPLMRNAVTKLRIANNTGSGLYIYKIVTRTYQEMSEVTLRSSTPTEGEVCFSNLKKTITLTFTKNVQVNSGTISLNGTSIPLNTCVINNNIVTIPVTLVGIQGANKNYNLTVTAGTFAEVGNLTNLSKNITVNFQTLKLVVYPTNYSAQLDVVYKNVNSTNCRMDIYYPTNATTLVPVVINMHGGGWVSGAKEEQGGFNMYFDRGYAVANVEYRMRYETLAPAAVEDVRGAMHYVLTHANELHIDVNKVIFQGGSAGGHLSLTAGYLQNDRIYDNDCQQYSGNIKVMAVIDKYGAADLLTFAPNYTGMLLWLGTHATDTTFMKTLSPVHLVNSKTPPTYIIHGDADPTIPYAQSVELQSTLQSAGVKNKFTTVPGGGHGGFPDAYNTQMENEVIAFLSEVISQLGTPVNTVGNVNTKVSLSGNKVNIESSETTLSTVFDCMGKVIFQTKDKSFKIAQKGIFVLKIMSDQNESVSKLIIR